MLLNGKFSLEPVFFTRRLTQSPRWQEQAVGAAGRCGAEMCERKMRQPHFRLSASRWGGGGERGVGGLDRGVGRKDRVSVSPFSVVFYPVTTRAVSSLVTVVPAEMIRAVISSTLPSQQFSSIQSFTELFIHRGDFPSFSLSLCCHLCCFNDILTV